MARLFNNLQRRPTWLVIIWMTNLLNKVSLQLCTFVRPVCGVFFGPSVPSFLLHYPFCYIFLHDPFVLLTFCFILFLIVSSSSIGFFLNPSLRPYFIIRRFQLQTHAPTWFFIVCNMVLAQRLIHDDSQVILWKDKFTESTRKISVNFLLRLPPYCSSSSIRFFFN